MYRIRTLAAQIMLAGRPGTRRTRIALAKVAPESWLSQDITWFGGLR